MAFTGVLRPGHIQLRVLDMGAAIEHYTETLGLVETGRDDSGRVYFKAWDEFDHSCLILRQADSAGMDFMAFRVADNDCLRGFEQKLTDAGFEITHHPAGDLLATGERISFVGPGGHRFELFADKEQVGSGMSTTNPDMFPEGLKGMHPSRFDHCALQAASIDACTTLFTDIFGFNISEKLVADDGKTLLIFLSCSNKPHDIAFLVGPADDGKIHHAAFYLESWADIQSAANIIGRKGVSLDIGPTQHGLTRGLTIYFFDPSGNRDEVFSGGYIYYPDRPTLLWTEDEMQKAVFYFGHEIPERFTTTVT